MNKETDIVITVNARKIVLGLSFAALLVVLGSIVGQMYTYLIGNGTGTLLINELYVDGEGNIPTFFSSLILSCVSVILGIIYTLKKRSRDAFRFHWLVLCGVAGLLAIDESTLLYHEMLSGMSTYLIRSISKTFVVIISILVMIPLLFQYTTFFLHFTNRYKILLAISATVFLTGAVGVDMLGTNYHEVHGQLNLHYSMMATLEKVLEIAGTILFMHTLLVYLSEWTSNTKENASLPEGAVEVLKNKETYPDPN
jgi:hypothetical protein